MKLFSLIASILLLGELFAQRPLVQLEVSPKEAEIGQSVTITVKANIQGDLEVDLPKAFESGHATMSSMQQEIDYTTGKVVTYFIHSQNGSFNKAGSFSVGPAFIRRGNKVFKSNVSAVSIKKEDLPDGNEQRFSNRQLAQPAFGIIQCSKRSVFEGEPMVFSAKIYARFSPTHLEGYESYTFQGSGEQHDLDEGSDQIAMKEERFGRANYYSFSYDKKLLFPLTAGKLKVEPYKMLLMRGFESFSLTSSPLSIDVKPLPKGAPANFTGGVGEFKATQQLSSEEVKQGDMVTLTRVISGRGNLHLIGFPELNIPKGMELYGDPEVKEQLTFGSEGAKGKITHTYHLKALESGDFQLPPFSLAYFDPEKEQYIQTKSTSEDLTISEDPSMAKSDKIRASEGGEESFHRANRNAENSQGGSLFPNWIWVLLTTIFALISFKLFRDRRKQTSTEPETFEEILQTNSKVESPPVSTTIDHLNNAYIALNRNDNSSFYSHTEKAVITALSDFLNKPETNRSALLSEMKDHSLHQIYSNWFADFDASRYGMGITDIEPKELIEQAERMITHLKA